ncbi:hypothetical protein Enr10x_51440 [Gimesia panareensis]|uniref:Uncharacterized protein n=1 Tax=Gimesia panareensis TaxID=2527978 RepID=A0A517QDT0_9PLAN|nr:hypothetical protein [Gimesia panareensis]QDT29788.1 hypothetical protein Enr10x_51440 [Gimesia panareensis]
MIPVPGARLKQILLESLILKSVRNQTYRGINAERSDDVRSEPITVESQVSLLNLKQGNGSIVFVFMHLHVFSNRDFETMTGTLDAPLQVSVIDCVEEFDDLGFVNSVIERLRIKIQSHLENAPEYFKSANLETKLTKCTARHFPNEIRWDIETETSGTINQKEFIVNSRSHGSAAEFREHFSTNIVSVASHLATDVKNLMTKDYDYEEDFVHAGDHKQVKDAIFDVTQNILETIDKHVDRQPGNFNKRWKRIQTSRWFIAGFVFLATIFYPALVNQFFNKWAKNQEEVLHASLLYSVFMTTCVFLLVHSWGYLIMPKQFFLVETAGQRALKNSGTSSILILKLVVVTLMGLLLLLLAFCGYALFLMVFE